MMAKFVIEISEAEKKKKRSWVYIASALAIIFFSLIFIVRNPTTIFPGSYVFMAVSMGIFVYQAINDLGKVKFAEIGKEKIEWFVNEKNQPHVLFNWNDVHWIKKESNGNIGFFFASSFCQSLRIADFSEADQLQLTALVVEYAHQRNIRLVNFSKPASAVA